MGGQLVKLVDQEDLVAITYRPHRQASDDHLPDVFDLRVRRRVELEDVNLTALGDLDAGVALAAGVRRRSLSAVQRLGEDARRGGLADAARPREDERLGDALARDGVLQGLGDAPLPNHVIETLGTVLSGDDLVGHDSRCRSDDGGRRRAAGPTATRTGLRHMSVTT